MIELAPALRDHLARLYPRHRVASIAALGKDVTTDATEKAAGYGTSLRISLVAEHEPPRELVFRVASSNEFGHDRPSDRAAAALLAYRDFAAVPDHVLPLDVGAIRDDGTLVSLRDCGEHYLIASYAPGTLYADDLRRIASSGAADDRDRARVDALAHYLAALHVPRGDAVRYRRSIRDLVGSGEGIFGIVDGFPAEVPGAPHQRVREIERRCVAWRDRLLAHEDRASRIHGDFHPFNILFEDTWPTLLDASRGTCGDPADDVTALAVNYIAFALDRPDGWAGLGPLWHRFWQTYTGTRGEAVYAIAPPFFAWRALVVCNPHFYPGFSAAARGALLGLVECALETHHLDPQWADELFR